MVTVSRAAESLLRITFMDGPSMASLLATASAVGMHQQALNGALSRSCVFESWDQKAELVDNQSDLFTLSKTR